VPSRPKTVDVSWVEGILSPSEFALWSKLNRADRRESIAVARRVEQSCGLDARFDDWCAAALLPDVGKLDADLGSYGRAVATVAGAFAGHDMAEAWQQRGGFTRRAGLYLRHPALGAERIRMVGGREVAAWWAEAHHDAGRWHDGPIPAAICGALARADGEIF
jgi:hypothetical protein